MTQTVLLDRGLTQRTFRTRGRSGGRTALDQSPMVRLRFAAPNGPDDGAGALCAAQGGARGDLFARACGAFSGGQSAGSGTDISQHDTKRLAPDEAFAC